LTIFLSYLSFTVFKKSILNHSFDRIRVIKKINFKIIVMRIFKKIITVLAILLLVIAAIGFIFFSPHMHFERSIVINQRPAVIYNYISDLKNFNEWSPFYKMDTTAKYELVNGSTGVGATLQWDSKKSDVGKGKLTLSDLKPDSVVRMTLKMDDNERPGYAYYTINPEGDSTKVTWGMDGDAGPNPLYRIMGAFMGSFMGKIFDQGLKDLKNNVENMETPREFKVEEVDVPAGNYMFVRDSANYKTISSRLGEDYGMIMQACGKQKLQIAGMPFAIYYTESDTAWAFDAGMPVDKKGKDEGRVKSGEMKAGKAIVVHYFGAYDGVGVAHKTADKYIASNNKKVIGAPWEVYVTDPGLEKDITKLQTDVYYPIE
jgi:effector-binding domain-containing protein